MTETPPTDDLIEIAAKAMWEYRVAFDRGKYGPRYDDTAPWDEQPEWVKGTVSGNVIAALSAVAPEIERRAKREALSDASKRITHEPNTLSGIWEGPDWTRGMLHAHYIVSEMIADLDAVATEGEPQ